MRKVNIIEAASVRPTDATGKVWDITLIRPGLSKNKRQYSPGILKEALPLFEGCWSYLDHPTEAQEQDRPERSIVEKAGKVTQVHSGVDGAMVGTLTVVNPWLRETMKNAHDLGMDDFVQFSINAVGTGENVREGGEEYFRIDRIDKVNSVDAVTTAAAGGKVNRLLAAVKKEASEMDWKEATFEALAKERPDIVEKIRTEEKAKAYGEKDELHAAKNAVAEAEGQVSELQGRLTEVEVERDGAIAKAEVAEVEVAKHVGQMRGLEGTRIVVEALKNAELPAKAQEYVRGLLAVAVRQFAESGDDDAEEKLRATVERAVADVKGLLEGFETQPKVEGMGTAGEADTLTDTLKVEDVGDDVFEAWRELTRQDEKVIREYYM